LELTAATYTSNGETVWTLQGEDIFRAVAVRVDSASSVYLISEQEEIDFASTPVIMKYASEPLVTSARVEKPLPARFSLKQNYPNPFNPTTTIQFTIPPRTSRSIENVSLKVFDILGREVATLLNEPLAAGSYQVTFDGSKLSSGIYIYQMTAGGFVNTKRMILVK
jgi:hypothetical protein